MLQHLRAIPVELSEVNFIDRPEINYIVRYKDGRSHRHYARIDYEAIGDFRVTKDRSLYDVDLLQDSLKSQLRLIHISPEIDTLWIDCLAIDESKITELDFYTRNKRLFLDGLRGPSTFIGSGLAFIEDNADDLPKGTPRVELVFQDYVVSGYIKTSVGKLRRHISKDELDHIAKEILEFFHISDTEYCLQVIIRWQHPRNFDEYIKTVTFSEEGLRQGRVFTIYDAASATKTAVNVELDPDDKDPVGTLKQLLCVATKKPPTNSINNNETTGSISGIHVKRSKAKKALSSTDKCVFIIAALGILASVFPLVYRLLQSAN